MGKKKSDPSFEQALTDLQQIVEGLESGELGLEEALAQFEQGIGLVKTCHDVLKQAEQRIELLTGQDAAGNPVTEPFDASATIDAEPAAADETGDENRLF